MPETTCRILFPFLTAIPFVLMAGLDRGKSPSSAQHNGWDQTLKLTNGTVEVIVVPAVGLVSGDTTLPRLAQPAKLSVNGFAAG